MATVTWIGNAAAVRQIDTITVSGTWAADDTATLTINGKDLVITVGTSGTAIADVAKAIRDAWNAPERLAGTGDPDATSNFGGQEFGEFAEAHASIDPDDTAIVLITAKKPGVPFTLSVAVATAGTGDATEATSQAATGPNHWNNVDNWDTGSVPVDDDVVVFRDSNVSAKYGLPTAGALEAEFIVHQSFTGMIGLYDINTDNAGKPYREYRQTYVILDDGGTGTALVHTFGLGTGTGSPFINILHTTTASTGPTLSAVVYNTGTPQVPGGKALNLDLDNQGQGGSITILHGSVRLDDFNDTDFNDIATVNVANNADVLIRDMNAGMTLNQSGGNVLIDETLILGMARTLNINGGVCEARNIKASGTAAATVTNGTLIWNSNKTIATLIIGTGGTFDAEKDSRAFTASTCDLFQGAKLWDEYARITYTAGIDLNRCGIDDVEVRVGNNRRLTIGSAA